VNDSVLEIKRWAIGRESEDVSKLSQSRLELAQLIDSLAARLPAKQAPPPPMRFPPEVVERLASRHTDNLPCFTQDLAAAAGHKVASYEAKRRRLRQPPRLIVSLKGDGGSHKIKRGGVNIVRQPPVTSRFCL
jgi:hypothetical protein